MDELLFEKRGEDEACCETLIVGGIYSEFFLLEGEYDGKKKYIDVLLVGMACFVDIHINHKENECLIEEIGIENILQTYVLQCTLAYEPICQHRNKCCLKNIIHAYIHRYHY